MAAGSGGVGPAALGRLAADDHRDVRAAALSDDLCPLAALVHIDTDFDGLVQQSAALNDLFPPHVLEKLSWSGYKSVRSLVGARTGCPRHVLDEMVESGATEDRVGVASNPECPADLLERLAGDNDGWVVEAVAENPSCPPEVLARLIARGDAAGWRASRNPALAKAQQPRLVPPSPRRRSEPQIDEIVVTGHGLRSVRGWPCLRSVGCVRVVVAGGGETG